MNRFCYCGSGFYCPEHPDVPAFTHGQGAQGSYSPAGTSYMRSDVNNNPSSGSSASPRERQKHAAGIPAPPPSKQLQSLSASTSPQDLASFRQIEIARRAAASLPTSYHAKEQEQAAKRVQAARAMDCWYLTVGEDRKTEPSEEVKAALRVSDQSRLEEAPLVLRKPQTSRIQCTECLKLGRWKTWKNNCNGGSAYHIRLHLIKEHYSAYLAACEQIQYIPTDSRIPVQSEDDVKEPLTPEGIVRYLTEWFAEDDISFNMVSHPGFRRFVNYIGQGKVTAKDLPDRHTISAKAAALSEQAKDRIKNEIKHARGRVSCTTDLWKDDLQRSFMCITAHFHNQHSHQVNRLIAFRVIEGTHAGSHLAETFFEVIEEFGITRKLGWITMDNASNNDSMMSQLEEYMMAQGMDFDQHGNRLRCFPHVVNLAVQDILGALAALATEYHDSISQQGYILDDELELYLSALSFELLSRIRKTITALRQAQRRQGLRRTIIEGNTNKSWDLKLLELKLDCLTRWLSTRDMIEHILYLYPAVSRYIASDPALAEYAITHSDYEVLHDILIVLNFAHQTQELLSSDKVPTLAFAIPLYHALVDHWTRLQSALPALSHAIKMLRCLEEEQKEHAEAVKLLTNSSQGSTTTETATKRLNTGYSSLLASGVGMQQASRSFPTPAKPSPASTQAAPAASTALASETSTHTAVPTAPQRPTSKRALNEATVELEHRRFEEEEIVPLEEMNGLTQIDYWLARSNNLPLVYRVALDVLPAQASSVSSERIFSSSKLTCTQHRNHIGASNVEALQILKHSLRSQTDTLFSDSHESLDFMIHHRDDFTGDGVILTVE
ncbi:unnamed protein product [Rhizoctonia solani]|uniref:HAT C-terminal dimerisation domain-containing protein n=1 Tax=Rhizoctonia solani TaxID=456999 RepID=A0A8H3CZ36_9AGAM|nr:unnamed protein product [Rhizoctonia solani]